MNYLSKILKSEFRDLIVRRTQMLAEYARGLHDVLEEIADDAHKATGSVSHSLLLQQINKLDSDYAEQEKKLFLDYAAALKKCEKLSLAEIREIHELALAEVKNKVNIAVAFVSDAAQRILPTATTIALQGAPLARLEYMAGLTLDKQIAEFDEVLKRISKKS